MSADAICLVVAGVIRAMLPATEFTLAWQHSVEKTRWEERYRVEGDRLALVEASVQGSGAGMEPAPSAHFANGRWTWQPSMVPLRELTLTRSTYAGDYELCWKGSCSALSTLLGTAPGSRTVELTACSSGVVKRDKR